MEIILQSHETAHLIFGPSSRFFNFNFLNAYGDEGFMSSCCVFIIRLRFMMNGIL